MSTITLVLLFILTVSVLFTLFGGSAARLQSTTNFRAPYRSLTLLYVWVVVAALGFLIYWYVGFDSIGSRRIPLEKQRRIQHSGYYFARDGKLILSGRLSTPSASDAELAQKFYREGSIQKLELIRRLVPTDLSDHKDEEQTTSQEGFSHPALGPNGSIVLKPDWQGPLARTWTLTYRAASWPLRIETTDNQKNVSRCINLPDVQWLTSGDSFLLSRTIGNQRQFVTIRWNSQSNIWGNTVDSYRYSAGTVGPNGLEYTSGPDLLMSEVVINDAVRLSDMVRLSKPDVQKVVRVLDQDWWSIFDNVVIAREIREDPNSRIGLFIEPELKRVPGAEIYKNYQTANPVRLTIDEMEHTRTVPSSASVIYGLGFKDSLQLRLSDTVQEDPIWGQVVYVKFGNASSWALPRSPHEKFIITSANDYIPLDGYFIDIGSSKHAFFAKGWLDSSLNSLNINDGKNIQKTAESKKLNSQTISDQSARTFGLHDPVSLGDFEQGVLVELVPTEAGVPFAGLKALVLLILGAAFLSLNTLRSSNLRPKLSLIWTLIWGILVSLLSVRLILSYRASLITPFNATPRELQNVFEKSLKLTLFALVVVGALMLVMPVFIIVLRWIGQQNWFQSLGQSRVIVALFAGTWTIITAAWIIGGSKIGTSQTFLGARINTEVHLLLLLGFIALARAACDGSWLIKILMLILIGVALGIQVLLVHDGGSIIYGISLGLALWLLFFWDSWLISSRTLRRRLGGAIISITPIIAIVLLLFLPQMVGGYVTQSKWLRSIPLPNVPETTFYRFVSFTDSEESLLQARNLEGETKMRLLLNNSLQNWQMLLYGAQGASGASGYGQAPLSKRGMTYATSMTDCVFAVYLLAEHGTLASMIVVLAFVSLGSVIMLAGWHLPDDLIHRVVPLVAIGAYFIFNALYMAAANVGITVFTGQNIPMLGLHSLGDLLQGLILIAVTGFLLLTPTADASAVAAIKARPTATGIVISSAVSALIWCAVLAIGTHNLGMQTKYRDDHDFSRKFFDGLDRNLAAWELDQQERMKAKQGAATQEVERRYAEQFNDRADKFNATGGLYYLEQSQEDSAQTKPLIKLNRHYFYTRSPFRDPAIWNGEIMSGGESNPSIGALGGTLTISLQNMGLPKSVDLTSSLPVHGPSSVLLTESGNQFCELKRRKENRDELSLDPKPRSDEWTVFVDGQKVSSIIPRLEPLSIIVIERKNARFRRNLIYLGSTTPILSFVRWRNGEQHRIFTEPDLPLSYLISKSLDAAVQNEKEDSSPGSKLANVASIKLTLDQSLHRELQKRLADYAATNQTYNIDQLAPNQLSVSVLDAFSGNILALPSWPIFDPGKRDFESQIDRLPESTRSRFLYNHNLTNHVAGSTIKPIVFSAMATELQPVGTDLALITVFNRADSYAGKATHPHLQVGHIKIDLWDCNDGTREFNMTDFLSHSRDYPEGVIGMLGMILDPNDVKNVLVPSNKPPDISYDGRDFELDLTRTSTTEKAFTLGDQRVGIMPKTTGPDTINRTILYTGLSSVFDFDNGKTDAEYLSESCSRFLPTILQSRFPLEQNLYIDNVLPGRMNMSGGSFQEIRGGLISCLLGGGDCGFNNVRMAEAAARLALGQRVFAKLEDRPISALGALPSPLVESIWRNEHIVTPMEKAGEEGTAASLEKTVRVPAGYRAIYKTGTILEGRGIRESETLMFVIGKWSNNEFVKGKTFAGYLYMEKSKDKKGEAGAKDTSMKKFAFAAPILNKIFAYLAERDLNSANQ